MFQLHVTCCYMIQYVFRLPDHQYGRLIYFFLSATAFKAVTAIRLASLRNVLDDLGRVESYLSQLSRASTFGTEDHGSVQIKALNYASRALRACVFMRRAWIAQTCDSSPSLTLLMRYCWSGSCYPAYSRYLSPC